MEDASELTADEWKAIAQLRARSGQGNGGNSPVPKEIENNGQLRTDPTAGTASESGESPPFTDRFGLSDEYSDLRERFAAEVGDDADFEQRLNRKKPRRGEINVRPWRL